MSVLLFSFSVIREWETRRNAWFPSENRNDQTVMAGKGTFDKRPLTERCDCNTKIDVSGDVTVLL